MNTFSKSLVKYMRGLPNVSVQESKNRSKFSNVHFICVQVQLRAASHFSDHDVSQRAHVELFKCRTHLNVVCMNPWRFPSNFVASCFNGVDWKDIDEKHH